VVKLKEAEIQQRAQADAQDNQIAQQKLAMDQQRLAQDAQIAQQRINSQENIAMLRADIAQQKAMQPRMPGSPRRNPNAA
jgi:hypothetical protein